MAQSQAPVNFFGGSPLNRLSWLRSSEHFLNAVALSSATRWILFEAGQPLMVSQPDSKKLTLARLTTTEVRPLLGSEPFFAQGQKDGDAAPSGVAVLESARIRGPGIIFLGLHEPENEGHALPSSDFNAKSDAEAVVHKIKGTPYFSLDVSSLEKAAVTTALEGAEVSQNGKSPIFTEPRKAMSNLDYFEGAVFAEARAMVDWNSRNKFCASCGNPVYSLWAGWKLSCSTLLPWNEKEGAEKCPTATGLHNQSHPRTDAVVIMAVVNEANDKILLGRNKKWPSKFYSALAGFIEPGETFEDAVKRELWEEAGLKVWGVKYHSTQPWPFPANLMAGFFAIADESAPTRVDLDNELEDARWYTREEILAVLNSTEGTNIRDPFKAFDAGENEPPFRLPPVTAIAGVLIQDWAHRKFVITGAEYRL
ncbi:NADH pyrophosphatase domain-containing protein [Phanerochaete sordida]|uniref:NAD(+) diphosphatase n=1 Tax=Phanerochaete sordida TaxID=48140 RepID=A0A9P3GDI5_9APHY|nr:NADH pyrophosphatase domain-containing protein [Phanerochaete sordida]